ncbi:uncharacterized protein LOC124622975 [Schistocerca americana]|uniref:uncharacterized protein LOC124622975 n=1 Tax=Schistocerca americana TaxID=7009 RepID=UPI001F4F5CFA|nr:uncharacterized protein LOC124622975 [Schistocerca americana]XP_049792467.1 uncharacterized protein LOC126199585 [Schistocerca nitens]XP_049837439.1 uncharacterized protein LOC126282051 [Schistocerca gregaria]XP_049938731.1 uncharacterized protein LOC126412883 [Schistocerca serialis cubense]
MSEPEDKWVPKHRTSSRPWLLGPPGVTPEKHSCLHDDYPPPVTMRPSVKGRQAQLLEAFLWQQALEEAAARMTRPQPVQEYSTEYRRHFYKDVPPSPLPRAQLDLHPLYWDAALSYWRDETGRRAFRRCSEFSKPLGEEMDRPMR